MNLNPNADFSNNLKTLLDEFNDDEITQFIQDNLDSILVLAQNNTSQNRDVINASINDIIENQLNKEDETNQD